MGDFSLKNIDDYYKKAIDSFSLIMSELGYEELDPYPLVSSEDRSVLFIGSATNVFKKYIINNTLPGSGYFLVQKCLRTRNLKSLFNDKVFPEWASYFTVLGAITSPTKINDLIEAVLFVTHAFGIDQRRLRINISSEDKDLMEFVKNEKYSGNYSINEDHVPGNIKAYRHKYGLDDTYGRNFNFSILNEEDGEYKDIGNIILIERDGIPIAAEVGIGIATLLARIFSFRNAIQTSVVSKIIPFEDGLLGKFTDALSATIAMIQCGVEPGSKGREYLLKVYIIALSYLAERMQISEHNIKNWSEEYELAEFGRKEGISDMVVGYINKYKHKVPIYTS